MRKCGNYSRGKSGECRECEKLGENTRKKDRVIGENTDREGDHSSDS